MIKTTLKVEGMMCGMCESHVNDEVRKNFAVSKVSSSHKNGTTEIISDEQLDEAKKLLSDDFSFVIQEVKAHSCINGELVNKKFDKGRGVKLVRDYYGLTDEDTYGFGDSMNDLEMMQTVGTSVCMENGADALKEIADIVCPSVENDGLAKAFSQLGL